MKEKPILQNGHETLRARAKEITPEEISSPHVQSIIMEMKQALRKAKDGVAIAAPQIGYSVRIFIIAGQVFTDNPKEFHAFEQVCINPVITKKSRKKNWVPEGCLSVRWWYGETHRSQQATITAYDEFGKPFTLNGSGLLAQIFQHEIDHLDGILFIDHAEKLHELTKEEQKEYE
ncbi:MAG: peptide deformylase [Candidatus Pacebacteria bacterium]|nr:peptide deformylase [Candidatus Paceibacterota bacterium]